mmetsp:Transcript_14562/g.45100  ORF Transcript_14562/g.45100 Transcript_14562/m.45100 type:complete len:582 (+) Transcript_14562:135-1880(+)
MACVLADRIITVREVCLCPQMDIAALVTGDGALLVNRTTSWQRFLALEVTGAISALCWSPHGRQLGVGHSRGSVSIFDIEAGALVHSNWGDCVQIKHVDCISLMWWTEQICAEPFVSANLNGGYGSRAEPFLSRAGAKLAPSSSDGNYETEWDTSRAQQPLTLLVTGDEAGTLILAINGIFPVVSIRLQGPAPVAVACCASGDLQSLYTWVQTVDGPKLETYRLGFLSKESEVFQAATVYLKISVLLRLAKEARNAALKAWSDALSPLDRKLELYGTALRDWHAGTGPLATAKANLLALVIHGVAGSATAQFLGDSMAEPSLSRTHKAVEAATSEAEAVLSDRVLVSARLMCYYAGELISSSRLNCHFEANDLGLDIELCRQLLAKAESLALSTECAISDMRRARMAISKLFKWFRDLHTAADKKSNAKDKDNADKFKLKDYEDVAILLDDERPLCPTSKTEVLLNLGVMRFLSNPDKVPSAGALKDPVCPPPGRPKLENIASQIRAFIQKEKREVAVLSDGDFPSKPESFGKEESAILHNRLQAVGTKSYNPSPRDKVFPLESNCDQFHHYFERGSHLDP